MKHSTPRVGFIYTPPVPPDHPAVVQAAQYVSCVFEPTDLVEVRVFRSAGGKVTAGESKFQVASKVPEVIGQIAVMSGNDVWPAIGVLPRKTEGGTTDTDAAYSRVVFVDYDGADYDAFRRRLAGIMPPPTLVIISGHGLHIYWRADERIDPDLFKSLQATLAAAFGSDLNVRNPGRVMRLPGFLNSKQEPAVPCKVIEAHPDRVYGREQLSATINSLTPSPPVVETPTTSRPVHRNNALTSVAGSLIRQKVPNQQVEQVLQIVNDVVFATPLHAKEVSGIASSIERYRAPGATPIAVPGLKVFTLSELKAQFPDRSPAVIEGLLRQREVMNVIGPPKVGKSWFVLMLVLFLATGRQWLGRFNVAKSKVLLVDNELQSRELAYRVNQSAAAIGLLAREYDANLTVMPMRHEGQPTVDLYMLEHALAQQFASGTFQVIVLDALYRFLPEGVDENANTDMTRVYNVLDRIARQQQAAIVVVHHTSKGSQSGKGVMDVGAGAGAIGRATDTHLVLRPHEQEGGIIIDAQRRSWKNDGPFCVRFTWPLYHLAPDLDPSQYARPGRSRDNDSQDAGTRQDEDMGRLLGIMTGVPQETAVIVAQASRLGLSERKAKQLLAAACAQGLCVQDRHSRKDVYSLAATSSRTPGHDNGEGPE